MNNDSSNTWVKAGTFLVVAAIVLFGGWYAWNMKTTADTAKDIAAKEAAVPKEQPVTQGGVQVSAPTTVAAQNTNSTDTSNAALDKDTAAIDAQMTGLNGDAAKVDASFSDQPVPAAE